MINIIFVEILSLRCAVDVCFLFFLDIFTAGVGGP
jgi:hypothetical protein